MDKEQGKVVLIETCNILDDLGIPFFLTYGTALGAYRDKGFVPDERDIDLGILSEEFVPYAAGLVSAFVRCHFEVTAMVSPFTRCWGVKIKKYGIKVDMPSYVRWDDQVYGDRSRFCCSTLKEHSHVYDHTLLESQEHIELFGRPMKVPSPIEKYLEVTYGKGWTVPSSRFKHVCQVNKYRVTRGIPATHLERL